VWNYTTAASAHVVFDPPPLCVLMAAKFHAYYHQYPLSVLNVQNVLNAVSLFMG